MMTKIVEDNEHGPRSKRVVILGSGFGGVNVYLNLHKLTHKGKLVEFTIISDKNYFLFTPLIHEVATGTLVPEDVISPIRGNIECCVTDFILDSVKSVDLKKNKVILEKREVDYDYLVIATGSTTNFRNIPGAKEFTLPLKTVEDAVLIKNKIIELFEEREERGEKKQIKIAVVGGGPTGIEIATEVSEFTDTLIPNYAIFKNKKTDIDIRILNASENFLPNFSSKLRKEVFNLFKSGKSPISLILNARAKEVLENRIILESIEAKSLDNTSSEEKNVDFDIAIWAAGVTPNVPEGEFVRTLSRRILVTENLNIKNTDNVFAIGDVADFDSPSLPQLAQTAVDESEFCARNIYNLIVKKPLKPFVFKQKGLILSLGHNNAAISIGKNVFMGKIAWFLWRYFYLSQMFGKGSKIKILINWILNEFSPRDISKI
ncbi:MAG: NAD(P)/FAD-dependent oxidoreductase [Patescibacteria group bacterium]